MSNVLNVFPDACKVRPSITNYKFFGLLKRCGDDSIKYTGAIGAFEASEVLVAAIVRRW
jgi:hypothetical protein